MQAPFSFAEWFAEAARCERCDHPSWAHGPGGICTECDTSHLGGSCGLLTLYGFELGALPLDERVLVPRG